MKRLFLLSLILSALLCCVSCTNTKTYDEGYEDGFNDAGGVINEAEQQRHVLQVIDNIQSEVNGEIMLIEWEVADEYGFHPDEAGAILEKFANGEDVSEVDLQKAIASICGYYYKSLDLPDRVEDMDMYY